MTTTTQSPRPSGPALCKRFTLLNNFGLLVFSKANDQTNATTQAEYGFGDASGRDLAAPSR
jgi:hypothetical protein